MARRSPALIVALAAVVCLVPACRSDPPSPAQESVTGSRPGQLRPVGIGHKLCVPTKVGPNEYVEGFDTFRNTGEVPLTVEGVDWREKGLVVRRISYLVRTASSRFATFGLRRGFPPEMTSSEARAWKGRKTLLGAELPPSGPGEYYVVLVQFEGTRGTAGPLQVTYSNGTSGTPRTAESFVTLAAARRC